MYVEHVRREAIFVGDAKAQTESALLGVRLTVPFVGNSTP
jgi:hypothetical protein